MPVISIPDSTALQQQLAKHGDKQLNIIDFTAKWCGPCKNIAPIYEELSKKYAEGCTFLKVDVDECPAIASRYEVSGMPTFLFIKGGKEIGRMSGANPTVLENWIQKYTAPKVDIFAGSGRKLGGSPGSSTSTTGSASGSPTAAGNNGSPNNFPGAAVALAAVGVAKPDYEGAQAALRIDPNQPVTRIQICWPDGSKCVVKLNPSDYICRIREFICTARPEFHYQPFSMSSTFPREVISNEDISIQQAKLEQASIQVKLIQ